MNRPRLGSLRSYPRVLRGHSRALREERAERRFDSRLRHDPEAPELLLSPHWDDAVLSCWSLLCDERELNVVNVFAAIPTPGRRATWDAVLGARDSSERASLRMAEDERALAGAGRRAVSLPLLDREYRAGPFALGLDDLDRALVSEVAGASRVHAPAGIGGHVDHVLTRRYARALLWAGIPVTLYAELPYCVFHGWPAWVRGSGPAPRRDVDAYWRSFLSGVPEMPPLSSGEVARLEPSRARAKREVIGRYEASLNWAVRRLLDDPELHGIEVRWSLGGVQRAASSAPADRRALARGRV